MNTGESTVDFLSGGGEMGALIRAYDWASTCIGAPETWPQSLRVTIRLMLNTRHPMFIWWGPNLIQFYNDAYAQTLGPERQPSALGQPGRECWEEIWEIIGPQIDYVLEGRGSTWDEERLVPVTRHGHRENIWWTYSYSPIDDDGAIGGVLVICNDVTDQHIAREELRDQTEQLTLLFDQAPGFMALLRGSDHRFELVNAAFRKLIGERDVIDLPVREAMPEVAGQEFLEPLDEAYTSGTPHVGERMSLRISPSPGAPLEQHFVDFVFQPVVARDGTITGIFVEGQDVTDQVRAEEDLMLINRELKHRVKNILSVVSAIASQSLRGAGEAAEEAVRNFQARLGAFGQAHDILTARPTASAGIREAVENALRPHQSDAGQIVIHPGPHLALSAKQSLALALALHELATNAIKYGALTTNDGRVDISWDITRDEEGTDLFTLSWTESGGPAVEKPTRTGFGSQLITRALSADFGGRVNVDYAPDGLRFLLVTDRANVNQHTD